MWVTSQGLAGPCQGTPTLWNQVENALNGGQLSTNCNEGYHSRLAGAVKQNSSLGPEAETRAMRDEDRAEIDYRDEDEEEGEDLDDSQPGAINKQWPGCGKDYQMAQSRRRLENIILKREEFAKVAYLKRVAHIELTNVFTSHFDI